MGKRVVVRRRRIARICGSGPAREKKVRSINAICMPPTNTVQNVVLTDGLKPPGGPPGGKENAGPELNLNEENPPGIPPPMGAPPLADGGGGPFFKPDTPILGPA